MTNFVLFLICYVSGQKGPIRIWVQEDAIFYKLVNLWNWFLHILYKGIILYQFIVCIISPSDLEQSFYKIYYYLKRNTEYWLATGTEGLLRFRLCMWEYVKHIHNIGLWASTTNFVLFDYMLYFRAKRAHIVYKLSTRRLICSKLVNIYMKLMTVYKAQFVPTHDMPYVTIIFYKLYYYLERNTEYGLTTGTADKVYVQLSFRLCVW